MIKKIFVKSDLWKKSWFSLWYPVYIFNILLIFQKSPDHNIQPFIGVFGTLSICKMDFFPDKFSSFKLLFFSQKTSSSMSVRVFNTFLISIPKCNYNIKFSKGRWKHCGRKQERNEFDDRNTWTYVRILFLIYSWEEVKATAHNIIVNETLAQAFFSKFCKIFKSTLLTEHLQATAFKEM